MESGLRHLAGFNGPGLDGCLGGRRQGSVFSQFDQTRSSSVQGEAFVAEPPSPFSPTTDVADRGGNTVYTVSPDNRVLAVVQPEQTGERPSFAGMLNFFDEINRRAAQNAGQ